MLLHTWAFFGFVIPVFAFPTPLGAAVLLSFGAAALVNLIKPPDWGSLNSRPKDVPQDGQPESATQSGTRGALGGEVEIGITVTRIAVVQTGTDSWEQVGEPVPAPIVWSPVQGYNEGGGWVERTEVQFGRTGALDFVGVAVAKGPAPRPPGSPSAFGSVGANQGGYSNTEIISWSYEIRLSAHQGDPVPYGDLPTLYKDTPEGFIPPKEPERRDAPPIPSPAPAAPPAPVPAPAPSKPQPLPGGPNPGNPDAPAPAPAPGPGQPTPNQSPAPTPTPVPLGVPGPSPGGGSPSFPPAPVPGGVLRSTGQTGAPLANPAAVGAPGTSGAPQFRPTTADGKVQPQPAPGPSTTPAGQKTIAGTQVQPLRVPETIAGVAQELGRVESKLESLLRGADRIGNPTNTLENISNLLGLVQLIYDLLTEDVAAAEYEMTAPCDKDELGNPLVFQRSFPAEDYGPATLRRTEAILDALATLARWKHRTCAPLGGQPVNNVTITAYEVMEP
jgi:hypothetical protein